jgi:hypothetical protein
LTNGQWSCGPTLMNARAQNRCSSAIAVETDSLSNLVTFF